MYTMNPTQTLIDCDLDANPGKEYRAWTSPDFDAARFQDMPQTEFRLLDDDENIYFTGQMTLERLDGDESQCFAPLDRTQNAYGCTELQYLQGGTWETL